MTLQRLISSEEKKIEIGQFSSKQRVAASGRTWACRVEYVNSTVTHIFLFFIQDRCLFPHIVSCICNTFL